MKKLLLPMLPVMALCLTACGEDEPPVPSDAITLNMMNQSNGQTILGGSDAYINDANNFASRYCVFADLGRKGNLGAQPVLNNLSQEVAVNPGNYYQLFLAEEVDEVAGARAVPVNASYYNIYVDSWIIGGDGKDAGAVVAYTECEPKDTGLPEWNADIDIYMNDREKAEYRFEKGSVIDPEYEIIGHDLLSETLEVAISGNRITFTNMAHAPQCTAHVIVLVRRGSLFTQVGFNVTTYEPAP